MEKIDSSTKTTEFLLSEFHESVSQWQHVEERMDKEVQFFFTLTGIAVSAVGLTSQFNKNILVLLLTAHILLFVIGIAGLRLLRRIVHLTTQAALYSAQIGLVRAYFKNYDNNLNKYSILTTARGNRSAHYFTPISKQLSVRGLQAANSLLVIIIICILPAYFYILLPANQFTNIWKTIITATAFLSIIIGTVFYAYQKKLGKNSDNYIENITQIVQIKQNETLEGGVVIHKTD